MSRKKKPQASSQHLQTLKIGSRLRCTDDGVTGRIVWANGTSVKIKWDDGEAVTWRRDSLATRPLDIFDADGDDDQSTVPAATNATAGIAAATTGEQPATPSDAAVVEPTATTEPLQAEPETTPAPTEQPQADPETTPTTVAQSQAEPETTTEAIEPAATEPAAAEQPVAVAEVAAAQTVPETTSNPVPTVAKPTRQRKASAAPKQKKVSALDAAARVLAEEARPLSCKELIAAMAAKGYWTSPGGQTPEATLYSAILRELATKGKDARFTKSERGKFARRA